MRKEYVRPTMYAEEFIAEQYVAAGDCGISVGTPDHGHFKNGAGETHCAFTKSNCGLLAEECKPASGACTTFNREKHQVITEENGKVIQKPNSSYHNCHILSSNEAAQAFVDTYTDEKCGAGVAALMGLKSFEQIENAFS